MRANVWGWSSPTTIAVFAAAAVLLATFVLLQLRRRYPLVPLRLFRSRTLLGADIGMLFAGAGLFAMFFFLTLYMQDVLHYSALRTGLGYLPISAMIITSATLGSRILGRVGARPILVTGFLLIGGGMGAAFVSMTSSAVAGVPREDAGVASALLNASQQIGGSLGLAVLTAVATARFDAVRPIHPTAASIAAANTSSWVWGFVVGALLLLGAAVVAGWLVRVPKEQLSPGEPGPEHEAVEPGGPRQPQLAASTGD